jgi:hypothetical protein
VLPDVTSNRNRILPSATVLAAVLAGLLIFGATAIRPVGVLASTSMAAACDGVNVRTSASTTGTIKASLKAGTTATVAATVSGGSWRATCSGMQVSGNGWYRISAINGKSVAALYGVTYLYAATGLLAQGAAATSAVDPLGSELMRLVNLDRQALGKPPMQIDPALASIARNAPFTCPTNSGMKVTGRAADMAARSYFSHTVPGCLRADGTAYRASDILSIVFGYTGPRTEIIAWNSAGTAAASYAIGCDLYGRNCKGGTATVPHTVAAAQRAFLSSSVHRNIQLGNYDRVGCGAARKDGSSRTYYACLVSVGGPAQLAAAPAHPTMVAACDGVNLRGSASTSGTIRTSIRAGTPVTVTGTVSGSSWKAVCAGTSVSGSTWHRISAVNGRSVSSLYGVTYLYAATGLLR